jgi:hypothetical protein
MTALVLGLQPPAGEETTDTHNWDETVAKAKNPARSLSRMIILHGVHVGVVI